MKNGKTTIYDIAEATGFSVGTVNRALNNKGRIKEDTKKLIIDTSKSLGYKVNAAAQGLRRNTIKIGAVLFCQVDEYVDYIICGMRKTAESLEKYNVFLDIIKIAYTTNAECIDKTSETLTYFSDNGYNGVVLFVSTPKNESEIIAKQMDEMKEKKMVVATVANDFPYTKRDFYVGIDAFTAGRMAAELLNLACGNKQVAILTCSKQSEVSKKYLNGFFDFAKDKFLKILIYEHLDDPTLVLKKTEEMINENPNLAGVYITSASSSLACKKIVELDKKNLKIITTDFLSDTYDFLLSGTICATVYQDPYKQGKEVVRLLYERILSPDEKTTEYNITPIMLFSSNSDKYKLL